jgi:enoyl-CoA hydratase/carnithine racemase
MTPETFALKAVAAELLSAQAEAGAIETEDRGDGVYVARIASQPLGVLRLGVKAAVYQLLYRLEERPQVRALIVTGVGRAFSAGSDIREFSQDTAYQERMALIDQALNDAVENSRLPVIAACNGITLGGGAELAMACDVRLAGESATFGFPEVKVGSIASAGGTQRLTDHVGPGRAALLLLTGRIIDAQTAATDGLIEGVVPDSALLAHAETLAREMAANSVFAIAATKRCLTARKRENREIGHHYERALAVAVGTSANAAEAQAAFIEKRKPVFIDDLPEWLNWERSGQHA